MKKLIIIIFSITFVFAEMGDVIHTIPTPGYYSNGLAWDGECRRRTPLGVNLRGVFFMQYLVHLLAFSNSKKTFGSSTIKPA